MNYWVNSRKVNNQPGGEDSVYVDVDLNLGKDNFSKSTSEVCFICQGDDTKDCVRIKICCGAPMIHNQCLTDWLNPNTSTGINLKCIYCNSVIRGKNQEGDYYHPNLFQLYAYPENHRDNSSLGGR